MHAALGVSGAIVAKTGTSVLHAKLGIFGAVPITILQDKRVTPNALKVYIALRSVEGTSDSCDPSQEYISKRAGIPVKAVTEAVACLVTSGWVECTNRGLGRTNVYQTCAYLKPVKEFERKDGREENFFHEEIQTPETIQSQEDIRPLIPENFGNQETGKLPVALKDLSHKTLNELPSEDGPSPTAPACSKKRDPHFKEFGDLITERGGSWAAGVKEAKALDGLIAWAKRVNPDSWIRYFHDFLDGAWALVCGNVAALAPKDRDFWKSQPYTPSRLLNHASAIVALLERVADSQTVPEEIKHIIGRKV